MGGSKERKKQWEDKKNNKNNGRTNVKIFVTIIIVFVNRNNLTMII